MLLLFSAVRITVFYSDPVALYIEKPLLPRFRVSKKNIYTLKGDVNIGKVVE